MIKLTLSGGSALFINPEEIVALQPLGPGSWAPGETSIKAADSWFTVIESPELIIRKIKEHKGD